MKQGDSPIFRISIGLLVSGFALCVGAPVFADERVASEDFASAQTLSFGPDNLTRKSLRADPAAPFPFDNALDLAPNSEILSGCLSVGPTDRGVLEDVVWMELRAFDEHYAGRRGDFTVVRFEPGGPELKLTRASSRPEAALKWFDGINWNATGATVPLDKRYRLRTVMDLDTGMMDVYLREEPSGKESALALGAPFRPFTAGALRRKFALGRPTEMQAAVAQWQLWRVGKSELIPLGTGTFSSPLEKVPVPLSGAKSKVPVPNVLAFAYAAPVTLEGDAVRRADETGAVGYSLRPVSGLRDDLELPDISRWFPAARVQRQTSFHRSGQWSLGLSEGARPVDTEIVLPRGDFELKLHFLVPREIPANRQIYLVRFKNVDTGSEPVGPSLYLDYGAAPAGKSLIICQVRPDQYYSQEVDVKPGVWYGLHLATRRANGAYVASFLDEAGKELPLNEGKPLAFFLDTPPGERVQWRFFSIISMRPGMTDWPKIDLAVKERRMQVTISDEARAKLKGLTLRGIRRDAKIDVDFGNPRSVYYAAARHGEVIDKNWPGFKLGKADAEKLKDYRALLIEGNVLLPWAGMEFACNVNGTMWMLAANSTEYVKADATAPDEFRPWLQAREKQIPLNRGVNTLSLLYMPSDPAEPRAELRWVSRGRNEPIPPELIRGEDTVIGHPGLPFEILGAGAVDDKLYLAVADVGMEVYDRTLVRTDFAPFRLEKAIGSRWYGVSTFAWDPWSQSFYVYTSKGQLAVKLDKTMTPREPVVRYPVGGIAMAAGPEGLYFITEAGDVVRTDKFFGASGGLPLDKMFGGKPLFGAAACVDHFLYLATRKDSTLFPSQVICVDVNNWHPVFSVELKDKFPDVTAMATDGETMYLFNRTSAQTAVFNVPPKHELEPQKTFVYLDDVEVAAVRASQDIQLLPGPAGDASGWTPAEAVIRNPNGDGWVFHGENARPAYERPGISYIDRDSPQDALLRVRTADSPVATGLRIDVHASENPVTARVIILGVDPTEEVKKNAALFGKTYSLEEFFCRPEFMTWRTKYAYWSLYLAGPRDGAQVRAIRIVPCGSGPQEHVLSLMKDFGVKPGESVDDIVLGRLNEPPTILSITLSPGEVTPREGSAGSATSRPAALDPSARRLEYLSWEEIPFDAGRGQMKVLVRTADEKYFIDRVAWTPVENGRTLAMPLGRYVQWRIEMTTKDPWRPPGASNLFFGLGRTDTARTAAGPSSRPPWLTLLLLVAASAAVAWLLIGRRSLWERRKRG